MIMKRRTTRKPPIEEFLALSDAEKDRVVAEFDKEFVLDTFRPLTAAQRRQWRRIKRKMGRPIKGQGHKVISMSLEKGLLKRADAFAKKSGMTRAALIARGLIAILPASKRSRAA
jgi:hypothetical protein